MRLDEIQSVSVNRGVVSATLEVLQEFGAYRCEGLVLWLGEIGHERARVIRVFVPDQQPIKSEEGVGYFVSGQTLFKLNRALAESGLRLIAQVHSHPHEAYHSETDDRYAIVTADGGLSLVVPDFGQAPADPTLWAVYRLVQGEWRELSPEDARGLLQLSEDQ